MLLNTTAGVPKMWRPPTQPLLTPSLQKYQSDGGLVGPFIRPGFRAFQQCSAAIRAELVGYINQEWSELNEAFINDKWSGGSDILYVWLSEEEHLIGCVAVDRHNFYPFISNLFVVPKMRKKGCAKKLIQHGVMCTQSLGFDTSRLWCKKELLAWYKGMGWVVDDERDTNGEVIYFLIRHD